MGHPFVDNYVWIRLIFDSYCQDFKFVDVHSFNLLRAAYIKKHLAKQRVRNDVFFFRVLRDAVTVFDPLCQKKT